MLPSPRVLSYDDLRKLAGKFLDEYWPDRTVPVDIEAIVDVGFGIDIVTVPHLYALVEVAGFITPDGSEIYLDRDVYEHPKLYHLRFTLAHELAHLYLHEDLLRAADYTTPEEWYEFQERFPEESRSWYEWQANSFAGLILVPAEALAEKLEEAKALAREGGMEVDLEDDRTRSYLTEWIGRRFEVSAEVISRRGRYDGYWESY